MVCFASIRHHKIACIFLVRTLTWVSIIYDMVNRLLHRLLIPTMPFTDCNRPGNHSVRFPLSYRHRTRTQSLQLGYYFSQNIAVQKELINLNWIVFESCITVSSVMNPYIISDIKDCHPNTSIRVFTNDWNLDYNQPSTMYLLPLRFFYNLDYISNILELINVTSQFRVTMDTNNIPSMFVHTGPDSVLDFISAAKYCAILILLPLIYLILPLMLPLSLIKSNRTWLFS